jgi:hypothetical protein
VLKQARAESQFSKAVDLGKDAIPAALLIDGHNPLKLIHNALSDRLHTGSDAECLELAASIRVLLGDLAERISLALKDHAELKNAVARLQKATNPQRSTARPQADATA